MRYLLIVTVLPTEDGGQCALNKGKQAGLPAWKLGNVLLWIEAAAKQILAT